MGILPWWKLQIRVEQPVLCNNICTAWSNRTFVYLSLSGWYFIILYYSMFVTFMPRKFFPWNPRDERWKAAWSSFTVTTLRRGCTVKKAFKYSWVGIIPAQGELGKWRPSWGREYRKAFFTVWLNCVRRQQKNGGLLHLLSLCHSRKKKIARARGSPRNICTANAANLIKEISKLMVSSKED